MKIVFEAVVMHVDWGMDNKVWVVEHENGKRELLTTSHGGEYIMSIDELNKKLKETAESLSGLMKIKQRIK